MVSLQMARRAQRSEKKGFFSAESCNLMTSTSRKDTRKRSLSMEIRSVIMAENYAKLVDENGGDSHSQRLAKTAKLSKNPSKAVLAWVTPIAQERLQRKTDLSSPVSSTPKMSVEDAAWAAMELAMALGDATQDG